MVQNAIENINFSIRLDSSKKAIDRFKRYIKKYNCPHITVDLSELNIIDAAKVVVLSSTYHYQQYPKGKLRCRVNSPDIKNFVSNFSVNNLEII